MMVMMVVMMVDAGGLRMLEPGHGEPWCSKQQL